MQIINPTQAAAGAICSDNGKRVSKLRNVLNNEGIEVFLTLILLYELWT
jgi:transcription antitermination factor NusA-like protein